MERAWVATARAATWMTPGRSWPAILYMSGIMRRRPWLAVKVVARTPSCKAPCKAPAAPPSDCISTTRGTLPKRLGRPWAAHSSESSAMGLEGVMG